MVEDESAVKDKRRLGHAVVNLPPVVRLELVPLSHDGDGVGTVEGLLGGLVAGDVLHVLRTHVVRDLVLLDLGIVDCELRAILDESLAHVDGRGLAGVAGVLLEREAQHRDLLVTDGVEHGGHHATHEAALLVVVHANHAVPVIRNLLQAVALADVREVQDIFLEAGPAEAHGGVQELGTDAAVRADGVRHLRDVGARGFAQSGHGVDGGDALGEKGVGGEFGELRGPEVGGDDLLLGDPVGVHLREGVDGSLASLVLDLTSDEDAVGLG